MPSERDRPEQDPAEGARDIVDHELQRQSDNADKANDAAQKDRKPNDRKPADKT